LALQEPQPQYTQIGPLKWVSFGTSFLTLRLAGQHHVSSAICDFPGIVARKTPSAFIIRLLATNEYFW
jgi:hypothetical protein